METQYDINSKLELSNVEMRRLGYQVVDMLIEHYQSLGYKPVQAYPLANREAMEARFREPLPQQGIGVDKLLQEVQQDVLEQNFHQIHPRDFGYVSGPGNFVAVLGGYAARRLQRFWRGMGGKPVSSHD